MKRAIFVPAIGQYDNIGDIVLRRPLLRWLRDSGPLHVFVGRGAPPGYVAALELGPGDRVYHSFVAWYLAGLRAGVAGRLHYAFKPGEIQMSLAGLKEHVAVLPLLVLARLGGGRIIRIGSGARNFARWPVPILRPSVSLSHLVLWRDAETARHVGLGGTMPDLGFADGDPRRPDSARKGLVVSMRGDRQPVPDRWIEAVRALARQRGLRIQVATQVARDEPMSLLLSRRLGAELLGWDGRDHIGQEARLRESYRHAAAVVSDRLHVLIAAFTYGAVPVGLLTDKSTKVARHFRSAGIDGVDIPIDGREVDELVDAMSRAIDRGDELSRGLDRARERLAEVRARVRTVLSGARAG